MKVAIIAENYKEYTVSGKVIKYLKKMFDADLIEVKNKKHLILDIEKLDLKKYDLIFSLGDNIAYGIITSPNTKHIHYSFNINPIWEYNERIYQNLSGIRKYLNILMSSPDRIWDRVASDRVDYFICSSKNTRKKIKKYYRRESTLIYPPVEPRFKNLDVKSLDSKYFLCVGSLKNYKKLEEVIKAFNKLGSKLKIVGSGDEKYINSLKSIAKININIEGSVTDNELDNIYKNAAALIYTEDENFATAALEMQMLGKPIIAYNQSSAADFVHERITGLTFNSIDSKTIIKTIKLFKTINFTPKNSVDNSMMYGIGDFQGNMLNFLKLNNIT